MSHSLTLRVVTEKIDKAGHANVSSDRQVIYPENTSMTLEPVENSGYLVPIFFLTYEFVFSLHFISWLVWK